MQVDDGGDLSRGNPGKLLDGSKYEALRSSDSEAALHVFRRTPQEMLDLPEQPQKIENLT
jgi:hypothetical protein